MTLSRIILSIILNLCRRKVLKILLIGFIEKMIRDKLVSERAAICGSFRLWLELGMHWKLLNQVAHFPMPID